jgi:hypothetical protein
VKNDANMRAIRSAISALKLAHDTGRLELRFRARLTELIDSVRQLHNDILADANTEGTPSLFKEGQ